MKQFEGRSFFFTKTIVTVVIVSGLTPIGISPVLAHSTDYGQTYGGGSSGQHDCDGAAETVTASTTPSVTPTSQPFPTEAAAEECDMPMTRLPERGGDAGNWGEIFNDVLRQEHNEEGVLKAEECLLTKADLAAVEALEQAIAANGARVMRCTCQRQRRSMRSP